MLFFILLTNFLLVGFVHNRYAPNFSEYSEYASQASESYQEESSNYSENYINNGLGKQYQSTSSQASESNHEESSNYSQSYMNNDLGTGNQYQSRSTQESESNHEESSSYMQNYMNNGLGNLGNMYQSSSSQASESNFEESSNYMQNYMNNGVGKGYGTRSPSASNANFDYKYYEKIFQTANINKNEIDIYLKYLSQISSEKISLFSEIIEYFNKNTQIITSDMVIDYESFFKEIKESYELLVKEKFFVADACWKSKKEILEKVKHKLSKSLKYINKECALYRLLYFVLEKEITYLPLVVSFDYYIFEQQSHYFSHSSKHSKDNSCKHSKDHASSGATRSVESSTTTTKVETSKYKNIFKKAHIQEDEIDIYLKYLNEISSKNINLFTEIIEYFNSNSQVITTDMIYDFESFFEEIQKAYKLLVKEKFFIAKADWKSKKEILERLKQKLSKALNYISKECPLYRLLYYVLEKDITYLPLVISFDYYILEQQSSYFSYSSTTSSSTSYNSSSTHEESSSDSYSYQSEVDVQY